MHAIGVYGVLVETVTCCAGDPSIQFFSTLCVSKNHSGRAV